MLIVRFTINILQIIIVIWFFFPAEFGSFCWDKTESKVIYIAERKLPKSEPFYKRQPVKSKPKDDTDDGPPVSKVINKFS